MKNKLIWLCLVILTACEATTPVVDPVRKPEELKPKKMVLAWGESRQEWTDHLIAEIDKAKWNPAIENYCKTVPLKECVAQAVSIMAKYESSFKNGEQFTESFNDSKGNPVISRGLLQLSFESSNQKAYSCGLKTPEDLHDAKINLSCGVKIVNYWLNRDLIFFGEKFDPVKNKMIYFGLGRYHSVGRSPSKSNIKVKTYLENLK